jgi:hypothetical protein
MCGRPRTSGVPGDNHVLHWAQSYRLRSGDDRVAPLKHDVHMSVNTNATDEENSVLKRQLVLPAAGAVPTHVQMGESA